MSSDADAAQIIAEYDSLFVSLSCSFAAMTYISYDWLLTLDEEIKLFWQRKVTAASLLYFFIRYLVIIYWILGYPTGPVKGVGCEAYLYIIFVLQLLIYVAPALFSTLRVYALTGQNKFLALAVLFFALGPIYANSVHYGWEKPRYLGPDIGCAVVDDATPTMGVMCVVFERSPKSSSLLKTWVADTVTGISRGMLSMSDLLVIVITWIKTSYLARNSEGLVGPSLTKTLLYSGVIYFIPLAILNILHTILTEIGAQQFLRHSSLVSVFIDPVTSVLASRFLLNLRRVEVDHQSGETASYSTTVRFTPDGGRTLPPFIASLGEFVDMGFAEHSTRNGDADCDYYTENHESQDVERTVGNGEPEPEKHYKCETSETDSPRDHEDVVEVLRVSTEPV